MSDLKIAVITGASRGLGRSMARHLANAGVGVIGTYHRRKDEADKLLAELEQAGVPAAVLPLDSGDSSGFAQFAHSVGVAVDGFGVDRFDYLVNNAGIGTYSPFTHTTEDQFDELVRVNLKAPFFLTQALLPLIADGGRVLNVSSGLVRETNPGFAAYAPPRVRSKCLPATRRKNSGSGESA